MLLGYQTQFDLMQTGHCSYREWRNSTRGSLYIRALCDVIGHYAKDEHPLDLISMMTRVCSRLNPANTRKKEVRLVNLPGQLLANGTVTTIESNGEVESLGWASLRAWNSNRINLVIEYKVYVRLIRPPQATTLKFV